MLNWLKKQTAESSAPAPIARAQDDLLSLPLFQFTDEPDSEFSIRNACSGVCVFGGTGSGKTSGSGSLLALSYLAAGFGGLVLTVKPEDLQQWEDWAIATNRQDDLIVFSPDSPSHHNPCFDFILYEQTREGEGAGKTENIVDMIMTAADIASGNVGGGVGGDLGFWRDAAKALVTNSVDLLNLTGEPINLINIMQVINTAPSSPMDERSREWFENSYLGQLILRGEDLGRDQKFNTREHRDFVLTRNYFFKEYAELGDRTRPSIRLNIISTLDILMRGDIGQMFSGEALIAPELTFGGSIIIVNLPVSEWGKLGRVAQGLYKFIFQKAVERRKPDPKMPPVFLWADEAQYFVNQHDQLFLTTARSARCMTVFLTQNIENYYLSIGDHATRSMLGNLQTKIFHQNLDLATNNYAGSLVGQHVVERQSRGFSYSPGGDPNLSFNQSEQDTLMLKPEHFNNLRTGGAANDFAVDAFVVQGGKYWGEEQRPFAAVTFDQRISDHV